LRRYRKIKEDMPLLSGEDRGRYFGKRGGLHQNKCHLSPSIFIYLLLSPCSKNYLPLSTRQAKLAKDI
ncbi:MAG: hypothetical protein U0K35_03850, partial [Prevotella sp.]|nr:hypothetical protein [Prevotella sp.]